jgi:hypothetical protein
MEEGDSGSGATATDSGAESGEKSENKTVRFEDHKRALDDLHKNKSKARELEDQVNTLNAKIQASEEASLAQQNDFKALAERHKSRAEELEAENRKLSDSFYTSKKYDAVFHNALKSGLRKEAEVDLEMLNLDGVSIERTDHGRVIVHGASSYVEELKRTRPHWFKSSDVARINAGGAGSNNLNSASELTPQYMAELSRKDPAKYKKLFPDYVRQKNSR